MKITYGIPVYYNPYVAADQAVLSEDPEVNPGRAPAAIFVRDAEALAKLGDVIGEIYRQRYAVEDCIEALEWRQLGIEPPAI